MWQKILSTPYDALFRCALMCSTLALTACGGGGDNGNANNTNNATALTGYLSGPAVSGILYETATHRDVTGADGGFQYEPGEWVSFSLGDTALGNAEGKEQITLFDLADTEIVIGNKAAAAAVHYFEDEEPTPDFHRVINLALLLQTLDFDGDPANGIEITADTIALFSGIDIDFTQDFNRFRTDTGFRTVLNQANSNNLLVDYRKVRLPWQALDHLYSALDVDPQLFALASDSEDSDADGTANYIYSYILDIAGYLTRIEFDNNGDGAADSATVYEYEDGYLIQLHEDEDNDGTADEAWMYTYDQDGNQTIEQHDYDGDGIIDEITELVYDTYGRQTIWRSDDGADGIFEYIYTSDYDAYGYLARSGEDHDGNGIEDASYTYTNDADGNLLVFEYDDDGDGTASQRSVFEYDNAGNRIREEDDNDADGTPDSIQAYEYDGDNRLTRYDVDYTNDGVIDRVESREYDGNGNLILFYRDNITDTADNFFRHYVYDANDNLISYKVEINGAFEEIRTYAYDADGNMLQKTIDHDGDGVVDENEEYEYDAYGNTINEQYDSNGDEIFDRTLVSTYQKTGWAWTFMSRAR